FFAILWQPLPVHAVLDVTVQVFVRIQLWGVLREVEDLEPILLILQPSLDRSRLMNAQIIDNQEDLPLRPTQQAREEHNEQSCRHAASADHPAYFALVRDRRHHVDAEATPRNL